MATEQHPITLSEFHVLLNQILADLKKAEEDSSVLLNRDSIQRLATLTDPRGTSSGVSLIDQLEPFFPDRWPATRPEIVKMWFQCFFPLNIEENTADIDREKLRSFLEKIHGNLPAVAGVSAPENLAISTSSPAPAAPALMTLSVSSSSSNESLTPGTLSLKEEPTARDIEVPNHSPESHLRPADHPQKEALLNICDSYFTHLKKELFAEYFDLRCAEKTEKDRQEIINNSIEQDKIFLFKKTDSEFLDILKNTRKGASLLSDDANASFAFSNLPARTNQKIDELFPSYRRKRASNSQEVIQTYWDAMPTELTRKYEIMLEIKAKIEANSSDLTNFINENKETLATHRNSKLERFVAAAAAFMFLPGITNLIIKGVTGYWFGGLYTSKGEQACDALLNILIPRATYTSALCR